MKGLWEQRMRFVLSVPTPRPYTQPHLLLTLPPRYIHPTSHLILRWTLAQP